MNLISMSASHVRLGSASGVGSTGPSLFKYVRSVASS